MQVMWFSWINDVKQCGGLNVGFRICTALFQKIQKRTSECCCHDQSLRYWCNHSRGVMNAINDNDNTFLRAAAFCSVTFHRPCFLRSAADSSAMTASKESRSRDRRCSVLVRSLCFCALSAVIRNSLVQFFVFSKTSSAFNLCSSSNIALFSRRNASKLECSVNA